ncbi:cAMP-dependent protein kinase catalytic subunit PRKX [Babesia sp. Xinjiang]|uniref:cAMP-dependent protein kinase catalytic subunit PRKX n=1 Tax=Babesia sp. Xinjiang TaxID=462227 RepID=UPI000A21AEA9|nr:cAMP-dependent protein kinase catalytic subunit PRKX [Babesia sp. Xinjiang]ORM40303.1 cAMP-dependent protein kinase catalytic subunit PRKX [Babesia sp. Xinjiang]
MGVSYSIAHSVTSDVDTKQPKGHVLKNYTPRLRQSVKRPTPFQPGQLMSNFMVKCNSITNHMICTTNDPSAEDCRRAWTASDGVNRSTSTSISTLPERLELACFDIGPTVGTGSYATVCIASLKSAPECHRSTFALKVLHKTKVIAERQVVHLRNERRILSAIKHPFIVQYLGSFQDDVNIYMLLEYVSGGELFSYIYKYGALGHTVARFYTAQAVLAIDFLHFKGIVYRDLKPENMLLDRFGHIRLVDFGFAKQVKNKTYTVCGTHDYLAPEIFLRCGHGVEADWWSLGVLVYEILTGAPPFHASDPCATYDLALENCVRFPRSIRFEVKDFIRRLLVVNPRKRLGGNNSSELYSHKFFRGLDWMKMLSKQLKPPIVPRVSGIADTTNYMNYPDDWRAHNARITAAEQDEYFSDF